MVAGGGPERDVTGERGPMAAGALPRARRRRGRDRRLGAQRSRRRAPSARNAYLLTWA